MSDNPAEAYESFFVPALFAPWAERVAEAAGAAAAARVLDVACGTGILARTIAAGAGPTGSVIGLDANEGMLAVARSRAPELEWKLGDAHELPFDDASFDAVACQFGLMFFDRPETAVAEMLRVTAPGGRTVVAVWDSIENCGGYAKLIALLDRMYGRKVGDTLRAPFSRGDRSQVGAMFDGASVEAGTYREPARFPSLRDWIAADVWGWLAHEHSFSDSDFERLLEEAGGILGEYVRPDGSVKVPMSAHVVVATKA
jgi:SAM-dependent methyltransferase